MLRNIQSWNKFGEKTEFMNGKNGLLLSHTALSRKSQSKIINFLRKINIPEKC